MHGQSKRYTHTRLGVGGRMDTLQCAVVLAKLERFEWEVAQRLAIGARYNALFAGKLPFVVQRAGRSSVFAQYTVFVDDRAAVQSRLASLGVPTATHYPLPLNQQAAYEGRSRGNATPHARAAAARVLSLPMSADLSVEDQQRVVQSLLG